MLIRHGLGRLGARAGQFRPSDEGRHSARGPVVGMAVTALLLGLMPLDGVAYAEPTPSPAVTVASGISALPGEWVGVPTTVTAFTSGELVVVASVPADGGLLRLDTDGLGFLALSYGYTSFTGQSSIGFHGSTAEVTAALADGLTWTPGSAAHPELSVAVGAYVGPDYAFNGNNLHYYQAVSSPSVPWTTARAAAQGASLDDLVGYLATITSAAENDFISKHVTAATAWIGATDSMALSGWANGTWVWADGPTEEMNDPFWTGTTKDAHGSLVTGKFASWAAPDEPNMDTGEYYAATNYGSPPGRWNDFNDAGDGKIHTYAVEFGDLEGSSFHSASTTAQLSITPNTDLAVGVTAPATAVTGAALSVELSATNHGPADTTGVVLEADVSDITAATTTTPDCTIAGGMLTCGPMALADGETFSATVTGTAPGAPKVITVQASLTSDLSDGDATNNTASAVTTVSTPPAPGVPGTPSAPEGAVASGSDTSTTSNGTATVGAGSITGIAQGIGGMTASQLGSIPSTPAPGAGAGDYFRVAFGAGSTFDSLTVRVKEPAAGSLFWWDGTVWRKLSSTRRDAATGDLLAVINSSSAPSITNLTVLDVAAGFTPVVRLGGTNRVNTSVAVSTEAYPKAGSADAAVLASESTFADALTGGPLAAAKHGPLLLTNSTSLPAAVAAELRRVLSAGSTVYILGGTSAVNAHVQAAVGALGFRVVRLEGVDRFATGVEIAQALGNPSVVFQVSGLDFADAMSAGPAAVATRGAVLLTRGSRQSAASLAYLSGRTTTRYAVGGPAAAADPSASAIVGSDRAATSVKVAQRFFPKPQGVGVALGNDFPDALVAAPYLGGLGHPLLLADRNHGPSTTVVGYLTTHSSGIDGVTVFGGTASVSAEQVRSFQLSLP